MRIRKIPPEIPPKNLGCSGLFRTAPDDLRKISHPCQCESLRRHWSMGNKHFSLPAILTLDFSSPSRINFYHYFMAASAPLDNSGAPARHYAGFLCLGESSQAQRIIAGSIAPNTTPRLRGNKSSVPGT